MNRLVAKTKSAATEGRPARAFPVAIAAFTLLELLTVVAIMGILAAFAVPALRGISQTNAMTAANRQLLDDIAMARLRAISGRTTVYMVFMPVSSPTRTFEAHRDLLTNDVQRRQWTNLMTKRFASYALLAKRSLGDQPGRDTPRYITDWRTLPEGVFIQTNKFRVVSAPWTILEATNRPFSYLEVPFPTGRSPRLQMPCLAFNPQGQLFYPEGQVPREPGEAIPLTRGSILYPKTSLGRFLAPDVVDTLARTYAENYNYVRIDWLTGRARVERPTLSP
jgi:prepilin-type N-terminal cleavage/methylation domain-containing protein